jgi:hypothetical protein
MVTKYEVENRLHAKKIVSEKYEKIVDKIFGNEKGLPRIFNYPVEKTDIESMVVAAYYLAKLERVNLLVDREEN